MSKNEIMIDEAIAETSDTEASETETTTTKKSTTKKATKKAATAPRKRPHMWKCYELPVHVTFTEPVLGTLPNDLFIYLHVVGKIVFLTIPFGF